MIASLNTMIVRRTHTPAKSVSYPWEVDWEAGETPVEHFWITDLKSSPKDLWPLLADTNSMNARLGLPEMVFEERDGQLHGSSGRFVTRQEWLEIPWEWELEKSLTAERRYSKGFASVVRARYLLSDRWGGTRLTIYFGWLPRRRWFRPLLRWANRWLEKRYNQVLAELDDLASGQTVIGRSQLLAKEATLDEVLLGKGFSKLTEAGASAAEAGRLAHYIRKATDDDLFRIRPKVLAFEWGMELDDVLRLLLLGTKSGLLSISWDVMCPHCQGVRRESKSLGELREFGHCDICDIDFGATKLDSIEVTFKVLPEIREVREVFYCSAEPAKKPHIFLQHHLAAGSSYKVDLELTEGRYRLRSATGAGPSRYIEAVPAGGDVEVAWDFQEDHSEPPTAVEQHVRLVVTNSEAEEQSVVLEKLAEDPMVLRPFDLFNLQQFRDVFSEDSIASGLKLEVGAQTLLFTDIVGSTALYSMLGDTKAFNVVHAHFVALQEIITSRKGAVVKTIGDAMMAAFRHPQEALEAAIEIQRMFRPGEQDIALRISIHRGQCLAVRFDANIDYFGNAVNYTAKMQSVAGAGEIVFSKEFYSLPNIAFQAQERELEMEEKPLRSRFLLGSNSVYLAKLKQ